MDEILYKTGTQSADDPFKFVMSDETRDRMGDIIMADGWDLHDFKKNPIALYMHNADRPIGSWKNVKVENKRLVGELHLADEGTSRFIDVVRKLLAQRHLKAVSVGFKPIKHEELDDDEKRGKGMFSSYRFLKQALLECSIVSVPANPNALALAKSLTSDERNLLFAEPGELLQRRALARTAETGRQKTPSGTGNTMSLADRIRTAQDELIAMKDQVTPLARKIEQDEDLTEQEHTDFGRMNADVAVLERNVENLRAAERVLAGKSSIIMPGGPGYTPPGSLAAPPTIQRQHMVSSKERPCDMLVKLAVCHALAHTKRLPLEQIKMERYPHRDDIDAVIKATTNPAMTTVAGWAAELVNTAVEDFLELLRPQSVYVQLSQMGLRFTFGRNGVIKIPRRTGSGSAAAGDLRGAFVGEGDPIPVRRAAFASVSLTPRKMGVISHFTREMAAHSTPAIESVIRTGMQEDTAIAIDVALLDAQAGTVVRPPGLMNGVSGTAGAAGGGIAAIQADLTAAITPFVTANAANNLVWLVNPIVINKLMFASTAVGVYPFKEDAANGKIGPYPYIASTLVPATTLILVRASDFASATGDEPEFDVSDQAVVHEDDGTYNIDQTVTQPASTVEQISTGATVPAGNIRSFWQTATIGIRMLLDMDWAMRRTGMVSAITAITW